VTNTEAWDRAAARRGDVRAVDTIHFGADLPTEADLRLCGNLKARRVLDVGCGAGENAVAMAGQGAHVIAIDASSAQLALARRHAEEAEVKVEWHHGDAADLAFLRADSIDLALATGVIQEVEDLDRLFRQVHRVLRAGAPFLFTHDHPMLLALDRDAAAAGALEVQRSYFDVRPVMATRDGEKVQLWPRTIADVFSALHRAGYRVDVLLEPSTVGSGDREPAVPTAVLWRARKEGV
jgi:ubiquinone/menaquinone biosynthesis C-methylase UbiE